MEAMTTTGAEIVVTHRLPITNRKALVPNPNIAEHAPAEVRDRIHPADWRAFSCDANRSISEWRDVSIRTVRIGRPLVCLAAACLVAAAILLASSLSRARVFAIPAACLSAVVGAAYGVLSWTGSRSERAARSDLKAVLDWHSEDKEGVTFELVKERAKGSKCLPRYLYYIKVTAEINADSSPKKSETSNGTPLPDLDSSSLSVEIEPGSCLREPLLKKERNQVD